MNKLLTLVLIIILGGYSLAFVLIKSRTSDNRNVGTSFCEGWQRGLEDAIAENPKSIIYKMPDCPEPSLQDDDFNGGYRNGFKYILKRQLADN